MQVTGPILCFKARTNVTKSSKQEYQCPHKSTDFLPIFFKYEKSIGLSLLQPFVSWTVGVPLDKLSELHGNVFHEKCEKCGKLYDRSFYVMDDDASLYFEGNTNIATFLRRSGEGNVFSRVCLSFWLYTERGWGIPVESPGPSPDPFLYKAPAPLYRIPAPLSATSSNLFNWNITVPVYQPLPSLPLVYY